MKANLTFRSSASHVDSLEQGLITQTSVSALALHGHLRSESSVSSWLVGGVRPSIGRSSARCHRGGDADVPLAVCA
ncbi:hypothetical protein QQF64_030556 [Cirrhinus molitorella]|uniref:Uncharacterized protein n=1 Tax=Cirrhinus molitorella TaxID=172907 RepID=A0ABR3N434_9TELE